MSDDLYTRYGLTPPEPDQHFIDAFNDALFGYVPPTPEQVERNRIAQEEWEKKTEFQRGFEERQGMVALGDVFDIEVSEDLLTARAIERCDGAFWCNMSKAEFQILIDALQGLCNTMKP